jgi:hypothetical protein
MGAPWNAAPCVTNDVPECRARRMALGPKHGPWPEAWPLARSSRGEGARASGRMALGPKPARGERARKRGARVVPLVLAARAHGNEANMTGR